jgi:hypothetical protein
MRRFTTSVLLIALCACSSTPQPATEAEMPALPPELEEKVLQGPDGWLYVGPAPDDETSDFVLSKEGESYAISGAEFATFVPTLGGNVFAVDELGVWWRFERGERVESMPWQQIRGTAEISGDGAELTGLWPVKLAVGGCAKVDHTGATVEQFPGAVAIQLVVQTWIIESEDGSLFVDAPGGEPLDGGVRYAAPNGAPLVYFPEDRMLFDPVHLDFKRLGAVPDARILTAADGELLLGLVPIFEGDETVALYDYYGGATLERRQRTIEVIQITEPAYSPHLDEGGEPANWDVVIGFAADEDRWSAYALGRDVREPRLELVLRGTGDETRARRLLEAELVSRRSHELAP